MYSQKRAYVKMRKATILLLLLSKSVSSQTTTVPLNFNQYLLGPSLTFLCTLFEVVKQIAGPIAALVLVWAGMIWITSQDDPAERKKAKQILVNVIVGAIIILLAGALAYIITKKAINC